MRPPQDVEADVRARLRVKPALGVVLLLLCSGLSRTASLQFGRWSLQAVTPRVTPVPLASQSTAGHSTTVRSGPQFLSASWSLSGRRETAIGAARRTPVEEVLAAWPATEAGDNPAEAVVRRAEALARAEWRGGEAEAGRGAASAFPELLASLARLAPDLSADQASRVMGALQALRPR
eukprot:EG_transcript_31300